MESEEKHRQYITQIIADTASKPWLITALLGLVAFLLGESVQQMNALRHEFERGMDQSQKNVDTVKQELRIMQVHMENTNAILIREGIEKPGDREGAGPTQPKR